MQIKFAKLKELVYFQQYRADYLSTFNKNSVHHKNVDQISLEGDRLIVDVQGETLIVPLMNVIYMSPNEEPASGNCTPSKTVGTATAQKK